MHADDGLLLHEAVVEPAWLDYNGHLNEAYYLLIFSHATDALMDRIGLDAAGRDRTGRTLYTLETHVCYLKEVVRGAVVAVATRILEVDTKRLHLFHTMRLRDEGVPVATAEKALLCVDRTGPRSAPFPLEIRRRLEEILAEQAPLGRPALAGRSVTMVRR